MEEINNNIVFDEETEKDFALIREFNSGKERSFSDLILRHRDKVRNLCYITLGDSDYVDDVIQDVLVNVYQNLNSFRFEAKFSTWLYRITVNKCRDYLRKKKIRKIFIAQEDDYNFVSSDRKHFENFDLGVILNKAIAKLPEKLKEPLILRDVEGYSYNEISEMLNVEIGTIKSRIFRARETLKALLKPYQENRM